MIRTAIIGCGAAGRGHIKAAQTQKGRVSVVAVADVRADVARQTAADFGIPVWYSDCAELMAKEALDYVTVTVPSDRHCEVVLQAAKNGLHVLCEKPIANTVEEGTCMVEAMREAKRLLGITYVYRFVPDTAKIKEVLDSGAIGKLLEVRYTRLGGGIFHALQKPPEGTEERRRLDMIYEREFGAHFDCGVHALDLFRWFTGSDARHITAQGTSHMGYDYNDAGTGILEMENGVRCIYDCGPVPKFADHGGHIFAIVCSGTEGTIHWRFSGEKNTDDAGWHTTVDVHTQDGKAHHEYPTYDKSRDLQHRQFAEAVPRGTLEGTAFPSPEDAVAVTALGLQFIDAMQSNQSTSPLR